MATTSMTGCRPNRNSPTTIGRQQVLPVAGCDNSEAELQEGRYFLRITTRLRRGRSLRPRGGSGSVGAITFAFSLL